LLFSGRTRDPWYRTSQTDFCPAATASFYLLKHSNNTKRTTRNHRDFIILHCSFTHLFSIKSLFFSWWLTW
jgi:hypothetical protein